MKVAGIVAEYNPFHNGHKYQLEKIKENGFSHVVAITSGNYVQRGDFSIFNKFSRAKAAVLSGVDLVLEIPVPYAISTAEKFSFGAIKALETLKVLDTLCFGAETDNIDLLKKISTTIKQNDLPISKYIKKGYSYPRAMTEAISNLDIFSDAEILQLQKPNNILGFEYINTLNILKSSIKPMVIKRESVDHDSIAEIDNITSASNIRKMIFQNKDYKKFIPQEVCNTYNLDIEKGHYILKEKKDFAVMSYLKRMNEEDFRKIFDVSEGIENRLVKKIKESCNYDKLLRNLKTKRYTMAKIRRILINSFLGIEKNIFKKDIKYIRVLGFNNKGIEILREIKDNKSDLKIVHNISEIKNIDIDFYNIEKRTSSLFGFCMKNPYPSNWEYVLKSGIIS